MPQEIARREAALSEREKNIERLGAGERPNNFPPFPKFCPAPFKPCFYINIKVEVPPSEQWKMYVLLALLICKFTSQEVQVSQCSAIIVHVHVCPLRHVGAFDH